MNLEVVCRKIYREAFCDPDTVFEDALFKNCFEYCHTLSIENKIVSMLFALPCNISTEEKNTNGIYIYAAATLKEEQGKGYMTELLEEIKECFNCPIFLRPANKPLVDFYKKTGFKEISTNNKSFGKLTATPKEGFEKLITELHLPPDTDDFILMYYSENELELNNIRFVNSMEQEE